MGRPKKVVEGKEVAEPDKFKIITLSSEVVKLMTEGFIGDRVNEALRRIENENEVVKSYEHKGERYFVVSA